jgi:ribose transport system permease protein
MLGVLLLLCVLFSILTVTEQYPTGAEGARVLFDEVLAKTAPTTPIITITPATEADSTFSIALHERLTASGFRKSLIIAGDPQAVRNRLSQLADSVTGSTIIATTDAFAPIVVSIKQQIPSIGSAPVVTPPSYQWPTFLLPDNLRNVANQISVIAIIAIGMTMVIITAGIDLSVGSLVALCAVLVAWIIGRLGGQSASTSSMLVACITSMSMCALIGVFSGLMITRFRIPPFIATLAMMQVAAGLAYIISQGKPIYQIPESFVWLGRGTDPLLKIPVAVILMAFFYIITHVLMTRTTLGRYIYAIGGNAEAARLAGVRVSKIILFVYAVSGLMAGLGGVVMASQLRSGAPTYGLTYELYVIAAVVVGGTSLSGGEGRIPGTLIGAFVIAVIQNGMNLTNVESYTQKVVLGLVILGAVLLDQLKQRRFRMLS